MNDNNLRVKLSADTKLLTAGLNRAQSSLKNFGSRMKAIGSQLQTRMALPLALAGGAAIKSAADFDKSMTKIKTLVGLSSDAVDGMSLKVKQLANDAGISSKDAAEALFFITSAGLRGDQALQVLEASTKAAALGLGETATVADLATSALNAYKGTGLDAVGATDILTAAVREGKLEASELAGSMGQVLPIASNMGVKFHEVGAAFAAMSRTGTNSSEAATQLKSILKSILKPSKQASDMLESLGLNSGILRKSIQEDGLLATLQLLKERFEGNDEAQQTVFNNSRALTGVMDMLGASLGDTVEIFGRMSDTAGTTEKAFDTLEKSSSFKLQKGLKQITNSFMDLGAVLMESLLPVAQKIINFVINLFNGFLQLDPLIQQIVIGFAAFAVALPTIITLIGTLSTAFAILSGPIGAVIAGIAAVAYIIYNNWNKILPIVVELYNSFVDLYNGSEILRIAIYGIKSAFASVFIGAKSMVDQVINTFGTLGKVISEIVTNGFDADVSGVLKEGFKNSIDITKKAGEDIADVFAEGYEKAIDSKLEKKTVQEFKDGLASAGDFIKKFGSDLFEGIGIKKVATPTANTEKATEALKNTGEVAETTNQKLGKVKTTTEELSKATQQLAFSVGDTLMNAFTELANGGNFFKALIQGLKQLIVKLIAAAAAAAVLFVLTGGASSGGSSLGSMKQIFGQLSGLEMADGGIVSGPTHALIGEYSGARSNPEVVAPLDKLKGMIAQSGGQNVNVGGEFRIQGQDLVVALQRAERNRKRIL